MWNLCEIIAHAWCKVVIENLAKQNKALLILGQVVLQGARPEFSTPAHECHQILVGSAAL